MMEENARLFNLKLAARERARLEALARTTGTTLSGAVIDSLNSAARLIVAANAQTFEARRTVHDRIGDDGQATITIVEGRAGRPVAHLIMGVRGDNPNLGGLRATAHAIGDRCHVFLEVEPELPPAPIVLKVGQVTLRVADVQIKVGEVPWPPTQKQDTPFPHSREAIQLTFDPVDLPELLGYETKAETEAAPPVADEVEPSLES
jgi:hypothetical protein